MDTTSEKIRKWIENGRDPRSAHWQAALEAVLDVFTPYLEPGRLTPVVPLAEDDIPGYHEALEVVDVSPNLLAAFLPPSVAGKITPPESAPELRRIEGQKPSYKILVRRPGKDQRTACAEISEAAAIPGVDLFQDGALIGTYNYENRLDCLTSLNQVINAHLWEKGKWSHDEYKRYTVNWFERVIDVNKTVSVRKNYSFLHTPSLIRINRVDAIFTLIYETFLKRAGEFGDRFNAAAKMAIHEYAEETLIQFLTVIKKFDLVDFKKFSKKENEQFTREYEWMIKKIAGRMTPEK
jgi:hypothetical protein